MKILETFRKTCCHKGELIANCIESVRLPGMQWNRPPTRSCAKMATCALRAVEATTATAAMHCDVTCDWRCLRTEGVGWSSGLDPGFRCEQLTDPVTLSLAFHALRFDLEWREPLYHRGMFALIKKCICMHQT